MRAWGLRGKALAYFAVVLTAGTVALVLSIVALPDAPIDLPTAVGLACVVALSALSHLRPFTLVWGGRRIAVQPDEGVLMVAVLYLPVSALVPAYAVASLVGQSLLRKPPEKVAFNVAVQAAATGLGIAAALFARSLGAPPLVAAALVPLVVSTANQLMVAVLLSLLQDAPAHAAFRNAPWVSILVAAFGGTAFGVLAVALLAFHPVALLLLVPAAWLALEAMGVAFRHQNELTARRQLNRAARDVLAARSEAAVVDRILEACKESFAAHSVAFHRLGAPVSAPVADVPRSAVRLRGDAYASDGSTLGWLDIVVNAKSASERKREEHLVELAASYLSLGLANVSALSSLERSERRTRLVLDNAPDPIVILSPSAAAPLYANTSAAKSDVLARLPVEARRSLVIAPASTVELAGADGSVWEASVVPMQWEGESSARLVTLRDVTLRRELEEERRRHEQELEHVGRMAALGTLVAGVAHEVNNPLTYVSGGLDLAMMDLADIEAETENPAHRELLRETVERLETVRAGAGRIATITKELKVIARAGDRPADEDVDLGAIVRDVRTLVAATLPAGVVLEVVVEDDAHISGSPDPLHQVVLNLVKNAIEAFGDGPGHVRVCVARQGDRALVRVADNGPGIAPEMQQRLFTPFFTTKHEGTGLGLSTAMAIVSGHKGVIRVESRVGQGSTFTVDLPVAAARPTVALKAAAGRHDL